MHVHPGADELNSVYQADLPILSGVGPFLREAAALNAPREIAWRDVAQNARADYEVWAKPVAAPGAVNPSDIFAWLTKHLPADAILANGAGNYAGWLHRFYLYRGLPDLAWSHEWRDGLWRAGFRGRENSPSRTHRRVLRGRWVFSDERARTCDRRAI